MRCKLLWFLWLHDRVGWCAGRVGRLAVIAVELMVRTAAQAGWQAYTLGVEQAVTGGAGEGRKPRHSRAVD